MNNKVRRKRNMPTIKQVGGVVVCVIIIALICENKRLKQNLLETKGELRNAILQNKGLMREVKNLAYHLGKVKVRKK